MSLHLLDLRPIKGFCAADKANLPVVVSRYADEVWDFYPYIPQENLPPVHKTIDWRLLLPDGRRLTDPEHVSLLDSSKEFIWSLFADPVEGRKCPSMLTLRNKVNDLKPLLRWMVSQGMPRFADLAGRTLDYVPLAKIGENGKAVVAGKVMHRLIVVEDLYLQRDKLHNSLPVHPWPHESAAFLAGRKRGSDHCKPMTEVIPDTVACRLAEVALDYIRNRSTRILAALDAARKAAAEKTASGHRKDAESKAVPPLPVQQDSGGLTT